MNTVARILTGLILLASLSKVIGQDNSMFGSSVFRNNVRPMVNVGLNFDMATGKNVLWSAAHGSGGYSSPVVGDGKVLVSTNNMAGYRPQHPRTKDRGVMLCFEEKTGKFMWQLTRNKLASGRVNDWPTLGMSSCACIQGHRAFVVTNRCELMCLDMSGFADGENDGPFTEEKDADVGDADIVWSLDMTKHLDVFPHNVSISSPVVYKDHVFVVTGNGADTSHRKIPSPDAPSFLCVNRKSGKVVWQDNSPGNQILHGSWSSPCIGVVDGRAQVCMPGGDGWLYGFDATAKEKTLLWKFDANPKQSQWKLGGAGDRNNIIGTPVFHEESFVVGTGQDVEHGSGPAFLYRIDATKRGDISAELGVRGKKGKPNPNSGMIWRYGGTDLDGSITGEKGESIFNRTVSTAAIYDGLVYIGDTLGYFHCVDFETGKSVYQYDTSSAITGSALLAEDKVLFGTEDGDLIVLKQGRELNEIKKFETDESIYTTPIIANRVLYLLSRTRLHAISVSK